MTCVIYYLKVQQTTWGLNTLFCGNLENWDICPNLIHMSFGELCFLLRFWFQTKRALAATCIGGTGAAARALLGTGFLSLLQLSLLMVLSYRNLSNGLIQESHQAPNPEKPTPNPTLFGICSLLETGKSILDLLRHA